ncbi:hypothetical protein [Trueperella bialowiezensis]|uniref:Uncharacterized protein n=1 Tax=Trueperella bialowiezensis TaxID=312285 RepID=A0A448PC20_9ACTO|nr:hypothetical protein [Trueperella bialowiezensis]VEI12446.1 Uncharacterised protein [Trueperella bialowiezensis]
MDSRIAAIDTRHGHALAALLGLVYPAAYAGHRAHAETAPLTLYVTQSDADQGHYLQLHDPSGPVFLPEAGAFSGICAAWQHARVSAGVQPWSTVTVNLDNGQARFTCDAPEFQQGFLNPAPESFTRPHNIRRDGMGNVVYAEDRGQDTSGGTLHRVTRRDRWGTPAADPRALRPRASSNKALTESLAERALRAVAHVCPDSHLAISVAVDADSEVVSLATRAGIVKRDVLEGRVKTELRHIAQEWFADWAEPEIEGLLVLRTERGESVVIEHPPAIDGITSGTYRSMFLRLCQLAGLELPAVASQANPWHVGRQLFDDELLGLERTSQSEGLLALLGDIAIRELWLTRGEQWRAGAVVVDPARSYIFGPDLYVLDQHAVTQLSFSDEAKNAAFSIGMSLANVTAGTTPVTQTVLVLPDGTISYLTDPKRAITDLLEDRDGTHGSGTSVTPWPATPIPTYSRGVIAQHCTDISALLTQMRNSADAALGYQWQAVGTVVTTSAEPCTCWILAGSEGEREWVPLAGAPVDVPNTLANSGYDYALISTATRNYYVSAIERVHASSDATSAHAALLSAAMNTSTT